MKHERGFCFLVLAGGETLIEEKASMVGGRPPHKWSAEYFYERDGRPPRKNSGFIDPLGQSSVCKPARLLFSKRCRRLFVLFCTIFFFFLVC